MLILYTSLIETQEQKSKFELLYEKYYRLMLYMAMAGAQRSDGSGGRGAYCLY